MRSKFEPDGVSSLEGLLRPDTYKISESQDEIAILETLVKTFDEHAEGLGLATANVQGHAAYDIIKVASIIEAEAKVDEDRQLIASVIYNRLAANMPLQIDATVLYARGNPANRKLSLEDLEIKSPYNTYLNAGLPPTPISAISDKSLLAAHGSGGDRLPVLRAGGQGRPSRVLVRPGTVAARCRRGAGARLAVIAATTRIAAVIGDPGAALVVAPPAQRGLPRAGPRLGARRVRGPRRRHAGARSTRRARSACSATR